VDLEEVRCRGEARGFLSPEASARASEEELLELLLKAGFSTRTSVSDVSGRGIGLDAVRAALGRIGGGMTISTRPLAGTRVSVRVPQAIRRIGALAFPARRAGILLAVHESWSVSIGPDDAPAKDPLEVLDTAREEPDGGGIVLLLERGKHALTVRAGGPPFTCVVERLCPTSDAHPVEVVLVTGDPGGEENEALLLRPERLM
jgi:two-component system chemotaxis sensor kinase CheA